MPASWQVELDAALAAENRDRQRIWTAYERAWTVNASPRMDSNTFVLLFYDSSLSKKALTLIHSSDAARQTLRGVLHQIQASDLDDFHVIRVFLALQDENWLEVWKRLRPNSSVSNSCSVISALIKGSLDQLGRAVVRRTLTATWPIPDLREEELEAIVKSLAIHGALTREYLGELGPAAEAAARRLTQRREISPDWIDAEPLPVIESATVSAEVRQRVAALLGPLRVTADIRDAGLRPDEIPGAAGVLERARELYEYLDHFGPGAHRIYEAISNLQLDGRAAGARAETVLAIPLIRLLHLRLILEAPSLRSALERPEDHLVPEVLLYVLGREGVVYAPELRLARDRDRRWRARWAESTGEALATIFLEDTVRLQLPTLCRIPERRDRATPDFMAETADREPVVFETKGSTDWRTHLAQRQKALQQLQKAPGTTAASAGSTWAGKGRAFACSLFASVQGADIASLFHVEDPVFAFRDLFGEAWSFSARRLHYAAVLQACEEYELADALLGRRTEDRERESRETASLSLGPGDGSPSFRGRFDRLDDLARRFAHPEPNSFRGLRVFRGMEERLYRELSSGRIPSERTVTEEGGAMARSAGPLLGERGSPRGVYSLLANGALLAFEVVAPDSA